MSISTLVLLIVQCEPRVSKLDGPVGARTELRMPIATRATGPHLTVGGLRLEGQVIDELDRPVEGAIVTTADFADSTSSGMDGSFAFEHVASGRYCVAATKGDDRFAHVVCRQLTAASEPFVLQLLPASRLEVVVVDADTKAPISDVSIEGDIEEIWHSQQIDPTITDREGRAIMRRLAPGWIARLDLSHTGYETKFEWYGLLADPGLVNKVTFELHHGASVTGTVIGSDGKPLANADVSVTSGEGRSSATSDVHGVWRFDALAPGLHEFRAWLDDAGAPKQLVELDGNNPRGGIVLQIPTEHGLHVAGVVVDERGTPMSGIDVQTSTSQFGASTTKSGSDGRFEQFVPAQEHIYVLATKDPLAAEVEIDPRNAGSLRLVLQPSIIEGIVVDKRGVSKPNATVTLDPTGNPFARRSVIVADEHGHFVISGIRPGEHSLAARAAGREDTRGVKSVTAETGDHDVHLVVEDTITISGSVTFADKPVTDFGVLLDEDEIDGPPEFEPHPKHSIDGQFTISGVPDGTYHLTIVGSGFTRKVVPVIVRGRDVELGPIVVDGGARISGRVLDLHGTPIAGAHVVVHREAYRQEPLFGALHVLANAEITTISDANGHYIVTGVEPSLATHIQATTGAEASIDYVVASGTTTLDLLVVGTGTIAGSTEGNLVSVRCVAVGAHDGGVIARTDLVDQFRCVDLPAGEYVIDSDHSGMRPVRATVVSGRTTKVRLKMGPTVNIRVDVGPRACTSLSIELDNHDVVDSRECSWGSFEVEPGAYLACADTNCVPIVVTNAENQVFGL